MSSTGFPSFPTPRRLLVALSSTLGLCALSCSAPGDPASNEPADAGIALIADELSLTPAALQLFPGQRAKLVVRISPPRVARVNLFLLGDAHDAFLSDLQIYTDPRGQGSSWLTATGPGASFQVWAETRSKSARTQIQVAELGHATLLIDPVYTGTRTVDQWTATVRPDTHCDAIVASASDGSLNVTGAVGQALRLRDAPVGSPLAVTVRAGQTVAGCQDLSGLFADEQRTVRIVAQDLPVRYSARDLQLSLQVLPDATLQQHFTAAISRLLDQWDTAPTDIDFVLDRMRAQLTTELSRLSFDDRRSRDNWAQLLGAALRPELAAHGLRDALQTWMRDGVVHWLSSASFAGQLSFGGDSSSAAVFDLAQVGGSPANDLGFPRTHLVQTTREPADHLRLAFSTYFVQSRLLTGLSQPGPSATSTPDALKELVDCTTLGQTLAGHSGGFAFADCGAQCAALLCDQGIDSAWRQLQLASQSPTPLPIVAETSISVDSELQPSTINGGWTGTLSDDDGSALSLFGKLSGVSTQPARP